MSVFLNKHRIAKNLFKIIWTISKLIKNITKPPKIEFIINCDDDVIIPEFGIKDIENY